MYTQYTPWKCRSLCTRYRNSHNAPVAAAKFMYFMSICLFLFYLDIVQAPERSRMYDMVTREWRMRNMAWYSGHIAYMHSYILTYYIIISSIFFFWWNCRCLHITCNYTYTQNKTRNNNNTIDENSNKQYCFSFNDLITSINIQKLKRIFFVDELLVFFFII